MSNLLRLGVGKAASGLTLTYIGSTSDTADASIYTFLTVPIGDEAADRLVIVTCAAANEADNGAAISAATIAAGAASINTTTGAGSSGGTGIFSRVVTTGTTATIVVTWNQSVQDCRIYVYTLTGYSSSTANGAGSTMSIGPSTSISTTANTPASGVAVFVAIKANTDTISWNVGAQDAFIEITSQESSSGKWVPTTSQTPQTFTASWTNSNGSRNISAASWL